MLGNPFRYASKLFLFLKKESFDNEERKEVEGIINSSPQIKVLYDELQDKKKISGQLAIINSFDTEAAYKKITRSGRLKRKIGLALRIASVIVLVAVAIPIVVFQMKGTKYNAESIGSGKTMLRASDGTIIRLDTVSTLAFGNHLSARNEKGILTLTEHTETANKRHKGRNVIEVPYKGTYKVVLPDGTKVSLNSGSVLEFPDYFMSEERVVNLKGEAFFDVVKSDGRPFIVNTDKLSIKVLGTKFNVKSYEDENNTYATLLEGKIELSTNKDQKAIHPGEQVVFDKKSTILDVKEIDTEPIVAWVDDMFYFDRTPLDDIMRSLSRWYGVDIRYADDDSNVKNIVYSGKVKMYTHPEDILRKFEKIGGVKFELTNSTIIISKRQ